MERLWPHPRCINRLRAAACQIDSRQIRLICVRCDVVTGGSEKRSERLIGLIFKLCGRHLWPELREVI
jgi:hypothetical protein